MFDIGDDETANPAVVDLARAIDRLTELSLDELSREELLSLVRSVETQRRRLPTIDHRLIVELDSRGVALELGVASTRTLLAGLLRITAGEAGGRVRAAGNLGPRAAMSGEPLAALFPVVAEAMAGGQISDRHAQIISGTVSALPAALQYEFALPVEQFLTEQATRFDPVGLASIALRVRETLDPDGKFSQPEDHERRRDICPRDNPDGSGRITGTVTPWLLATLRATLDPLTRPVPAAPADPPVRDPRTAGQRTHDALQELCDRVLRSGSLPDCGGTPATLLITMTIEQLQHGSGLAVTGTGTPLPVEEILRRAGDAKILPVVLDRHGAVVAIGHAQRLATPAQRLALAVRDGGCSVPGCDIPPDWCQTHHVTDWIHRRRTVLDELTLVCLFHHLVAVAQGWDCVMIDGIPHWRAPARLDHRRTPTRNLMHHLDRIIFDPPTPADDSSSADSSAEESDATARPLVTA